MKTKLIDGQGPSPREEPREIMVDLGELHIPVLLDRCVSLMEPALQESTAIAVDGTLGLGGHSLEILSRTPARVLGIDRDPAALALASERLNGFGDRFSAVLGTYDQVLELTGPESVDAILLDLGVSSMQLDETDRGFSYARDAELDMRMDQTQGQTAADLLARADVDELTRIFREYGEERFAWQVAKRIVATRVSAPITRSSQLNELVASVIPVTPKNTGHPAKRIYQALRIAVNNELEILADTIPAAIAALRPGGVLVVMSYHSLEDNIVKTAMQAAATSSAPLGLPMELPGMAPKFKILTRGVERASDAELLQNPRAASARLRAGEKLKGN